MGKRVFVRTSERKSFANCRQQWEWSYINGWEAKRQKPALVFGSLVHAALAVYYPPGRKRGPMPWLTFERLYDEMVEEGGYEFDVKDDEEKVDARELGIEMLRGYVQRWGPEPHLKVISPELDFQVDVFGDAGEYLFTYAGSFDLAYEDVDLGQLGLIETKTAASIHTRFLSMDEQASSYWVFAPLVLQAMGRIPKGRDINFILYNFLRKGMPDTRPRLEDGSFLNNPTKEQLLAAFEDRGVGVKKSLTVEVLKEHLRTLGVDPALLGSPSKSQPKPLFERKRVYRDVTDRERLVERFRAQAKEMAMARAGELEIYKNPGLSYPNQQCIGCEFSDICEMHETGGQWEELARYTMGTWDPYESHRGVPQTAPASGPPGQLVVVRKQLQPIVRKK